MFFSDRYHICGVDPYERAPFNGPFGPILWCGIAWFDLFPLLITFGKLGAGFANGSIALYIGGIALSLDMTLNYILRTLIQQDGPRPCLVHDIYQMPALASQVVAFFLTGFLLFGTIYHFRFSRTTLWMLVIIAIMALYRRVFDGFNTPLQLLVGFLVGSLDAVIQHFFLYYYIAPTLPWICTTWPARALGVVNYRFGRESKVAEADRVWFTAEGGVGESIRRAARPTPNMATLKPMLR